jgi:26 proteasome complex subunit DSS1
MESRSCTMAWIDIDLDWADAETEVAISGGKEHLWEEQWDDDDAEDDFAAQLR